MKFVSTEGGPLIAIPASRAKLWRGTDPPDGAPAAWEWSGDPEDRIKTDYDRACGKLRGRHESGYGAIGLLKFGDVDALVLERATDTTFVALADGGAYLRNAPVETASAARKALESAPRWTKTKIELTVSDDPLTLFDAAYPFRSARPRLTAKLAPARYRILACDFSSPVTPGYELYAYRFLRVER